MHLTRLLLFKGPRPKVPVEDMKFLLGQIRSHQPQWISRTVMVKDNDVDGGMRILNGIMSNEGMTQRWRYTRRYVKPTQQRSHINFERSKAIYDEDMSNRIRFIMRKNRKDPYPGNA